MSQRAAISLLLLATAAAAVVACDSKPAKPLVSTGTPTAPVAAAPAPAAAPDAGTAPKEKAPEWVYNSIGKRDPFKSFLSQEGDKNQTNNRCNSPLGKYELDQLKLVAVITGLSDPLAMVELPTGVGYTVRRGVCIGRNGGTVAAIRTGEVVVSEWVVKADQTKEKTQTVLKQPRPGGTEGTETEFRSTTTSSSAPSDSGRSGGGSPPRGGSR